MLAQDEASLALVRDLRVLLVDVIQALDDNPCRTDWSRCSRARMQASNDLNANQVGWEGRC